MGEWMNKYGETIYGTDGAGVSEPWGTVTRKGDKLFVHILADEMPAQVTVPLDKKARKVVTFDGKASLKHRYDKKTKVLEIETVNLAPDTDCILEVQL